MPDVKILGLIMFFLAFVLMALTNAPTYLTTEINIRIIYTAMLFGFVTVTFAVVLGRKT